MAEKERIISINIEDEMKKSYIDYSMSVIVSRALPDVRDGLKPVHRRILYGMDDLGLNYNRAHKKSARIVGEVLGKYHPHGDTAVYDAMVRMAQDWSLRYTLVDGQGNFGSMDGDRAAAMRYTEARLTKLAHELLMDIKKDTVDFSLNFDDTIEEPTVLPTRLPNLLMNGASGIAVGMATNMLPHNLTEVVNGAIATIDNPDITIDELMTYIPAPDFPTGGIIQGISGVKKAFRTGRGRVVVRGKAEITTTDTGRERIIITEIPYQVNKASLLVKISELVNEERIKGISYVADESDRNGLRIVVDIKRDAIANVVLNRLYKLTALQSSYGVNNIALVNGRPELLSLKEMLQHFIDFRIEVIVRRTEFDLRKARERAHILEGLLIALDNLDEIIALIRGSATVDEAQEGLMTRFNLSELQSKAILNMRLQTLTGLERAKIKEEYDELQKQITRYLEILGSVDIQKEIVKGELIEVKEEYGDDRRSEIDYTDSEIRIEDLIPNDRVVVTISHLGYIKRTKVSEYKTQYRGGKGSRGSKTRDEDFIEHMFIAESHNYLLLFTEQGRCFWIRVFDIPESSKTSTGRVIQNLVAIPREDKVRAYINIEDLEDEDYVNNNYLIFATKKGIVKKTLVEAYSRPRTNGINAITIAEGDQLIDVKLTDGTNQIILANRNGRAIRFNEEDVRPMGRNAMGVIGMRLDGDDDYIIGISSISGTEPDMTIMTISEKGIGKRSLSEEYRLINRGGKGVITQTITDRTGKLVSMKAVVAEDDLMITTKDGIVIRMSVEDVHIRGRATQGVIVIDLDKKDEIADVAVIRDGEDDLYDEEE